MAVRIARRSGAAAGTLVTMEFTANAFLQHMVRNLVGTLSEIGRGAVPYAAAADILAGRDRAAAGVTAPPAGLTLVDVAYPDRYALPACTDDGLPW
jgi:tRNA pseudouridine38-40 synthase